MAMHPELAKRLTLAQLHEALQVDGVMSGVMQLEEVGYPTFFVRITNRQGMIRLLRFDCTNYDFQPMAIEPVDPVSREPLPDSTWMRRNGGPFPPHHLRGGRPFLCLEGTRDYYTHEGHRPSVTNQRWEQHRPDMKIADILRVIKCKFASGEWE